MDYSAFSSLIYRIVGTPEKWQERSIDKMHTLLDDCADLDQPEIHSELELGHTIIERLNNNKNALKAFSTFLENSRYGLIIFDHQYKYIYHNSKADKALPSLIQKDYLSSGVITKIKQAIGNSQTDKPHLLLIDARSIEYKQLYVRITQAHDDENNTSKSFYALLFPVFSEEKIKLNSDLKLKYYLSAKEESVLIGLIEGSSISQLSQDTFVSVNTIKTQLKSIFHKTNTNSQTEVVRLFLNHEIQLLESYFDLNMPEANFAENRQDKFLTLSNKHQLCYRTYGSKSARPIVVMHNNYGCRLDVPPNIDRLCEDNNLYIIIPDRPGYGKTPFISGYPSNWNQALSKLIDHLELSSFDLLGNKLGCPSALNYCLMKDPRLNKVILACPIFFTDAEHSHYFGRILYFASRVIKSSRVVATEVYKLWLKSMVLDADKNFRHMLDTNLGSNERDLLEDQDFIRTVIANFKEGQSLTQKGAIADILTGLSPLNFDLEEITTPIELWVGSEDKMVTYEGVKINSQSLQNKTIHLKEGYGNNLYYSLFDEITAQ